MANAVDAAPGSRSGPSGGGPNPAPRAGRSRLAHIEERMALYLLIPTFVILALIAAAITYAVAQTVTGANNPDVDPALAQIGTDWITQILNCLEIADTASLGKYNTWGEGRRGVGGTDARHGAAAGAVGRGEGAAC